MRPSFARIIAATLITALVLLIALSAAMAVRMQNVTRRQQQQINRHVREVVLVERLSVSSERSARAVRALLLTGAAEHRDALARARATFHVTLEDLHDVATSDATRRLYERIAEQQREVEQAASRAIALLHTDNDGAAATESFVADLEPRRADLDALLTTATDLTEARLFDVREGGGASVPLAFRSLAVAIAAALILAALTGAYLIRTLRQLDKEREGLELRVADRTRELQSANAQLHLLASKDGLTGVWNRSAFDTRLADESARADRYGLPLALALVDIDHFKSINDRFGHQAGDEVIRNLTEVLKQSLRQTDYLARYGGEEFAIILVNTDREGAALVAERLRQDVEGSTWPQSKVTISVGVASWAPSLRSPEALLRRTDEALYASKHAGRNRVTYADAPQADA